MLSDINLNIPEGKVTAIVGASGSGKTTLIKLLLGYYDVPQGDIYIGDQHLKTIIVVAHRLSTVMNANNIVVLNNGRIVEESSHEELTALKSEYYMFSKNQLELGL